MIEKIIEISNVGHFVNFQFRGSQEWNGEFRKLNIIYAPNGSGKTTLATIFKSLAQNNVDLLKYKRTFGTQAVPCVKIKSSGGGIIQYDNTSWSSNTLRIEVFDVNYIEEYLFAGSLAGKRNKSNLFRLMFAGKGVDLRGRMRPLINRKDLLIKKLSADKSNEPILNELAEVNEILDPMLLEFEEYSKPIYQRHVELVNKYLGKFTSYIRLNEFSHMKLGSDFERFRIYPVLNVYEERVLFETPNVNSKIANARYALSEGDKSTIALSFFLARLEYLGVSNQIVIFDDPLSSFDYSRRNATIYQLAKMASSAIQFFILTHDLAFATDFSDKCAFLDHLTLKIQNDGKSSSLARHNFHGEFLTGTQKDINVIKDFLVKGATSELAKREVIRCMRPVIEGVFKTKYFDIISNELWLGDIIELIRKAQPGERLIRLLPIVEDIIEINDYTKAFHHASGNLRDNHVDDEELRRYINLLMGVVDNI